MNKLLIKPKNSVKWDAVSLGEVMIRFDPGESRVKVSRQFNVSEGGGEYNVIRGLKRCFNLKTAVVTGNIKNEVGYLLEDLLFQSGVDQSHVKWFEFDGIGKYGRVGLNFTERGFGLRGAVGVSDRANSAASLLKKGDINWDKIFKEEGTRWFHTGGIFAGLSSTTPELTIEAVQKAKENGVVTSYDINYRPSLWKDNGGLENCRKVNEKIVKYVDVLFAGAEDFQNILGVDIEDLKSEDFNLDNHKKIIARVLAKYPNLKVIGSTVRSVKSASVNDWKTVFYYNNDFHESLSYKDVSILDRIGGGDSFASGLIYGFLEGKTPDEIVNYGAANAALTMTTPGDTSMASLEEIENLMHGGSARVKR